MQKRLDLKSVSIKQFVISNAAVIMCLLLILYNSIFTSKFVQINTIWNLMSQTASLMFVTMGMTVVISAGCTDLSVGAIMAISSSICGEYIVSGGNEGIGLLLALAACLVCGLINGVLVAKFKLQPLVAMLVTRMVYRAFAQIYTSGIARNVPSSLGKLIAQTRLFSIRMPVLIFPMAAVILLTLFLVKKTVFGKRVEAVGNNQRTAYLCGVSVAGTIIAVYLLSAVFAGMGGLLEMFRSGATDANTIGIDYEMSAIAATTIGGTSMRGGKARVFGAAAGALLMTLITMTVNFTNIPYQLANVLKAVVIVLALALQSQNRS